MSFRGQLDRQSSSLLIIGLFSLMAIVLPGCGGGGGKTSYQQFQDRQAGFSDIIKAAGGTAARQGESLGGFNMDGWRIDLHGAEISDKLIDQIIEHCSQPTQPVFQLNLSGSKITDAQLVKLDKGKVLIKVYEMDLSDTAITDAGLEQIENMYIITTLNLKGSQATKEGARKLGAKKISNPQTPKFLKKQPTVTI